LVFKLIREVAVKVKLSFVRVKDMLEDLERQLGLYFEKHEKAYQDQIQVNALNGPHAG